MVRTRCGEAMVVRCRSDESLILRFRVWLTDGGGFGSYSGRWGVQKLFRCDECLILRFRVWLTGGGGFGSYSGWVKGDG